LSELIESVVVKETWFFRDREPFRALARLWRKNGCRLNRVVNLSLQAAAVSRTASSRMRSRLPGLREAQMSNG